MVRPFLTFIALACVGLVFAACQFQRSADAERARTKMMGMSKEQVLTCMGPPKQKAKVETTEVWSYGSSSGGGSSYGLSSRRGSRSSADSFSFDTRDKGSCTVNVVMKEDEVVKVNYNGPRGGWLAEDEQCAYAVEHCVEN